MGKYIKLVIGLFLVLTSTVGAFSVLTGGVEEAARRIVENGVDTTGVIEHRTKHTVRGRVGRIGGKGTYYTMTYSFVTKEGEKYGGEVNVTEEQAYALTDGEKITVRYHAKQPSISSPLGFEEYMTEQDVQELPKGMMLGSSLFMLLGGLWLAWSGWRRIQEETGLFAGMGQSQAASSTLAQDRLASVGRSSDKPMFGKR